MMLFDSGWLDIPSGLKRGLVEVTSAPLWFFDRQTMAALAEPSGTQATFRTANGSSQIAMTLRFSSAEGI